MGAFDANHRVEVVCFVDNIRWGHQFSLSSSVPVLLYDKIVVLVNMCPSEVITFMKAPSCCVNKTESKASNGTLVLYFMHVHVRSLQF